MMVNSFTCSTDGSMAVTPACRVFMENYCKTDDLDGTYIQKWQGDEITSKCRGFVALNTGLQAQYVPVTDGYVRRYLITDSNPITYPQQGSLIYQPAIADVVKVCQSYPGACDNALGSVCSGFTREDLKDNPNMARLCGCFMSDNVYDTYTGAFGVSKICDPLCVLQSAVKPRDPNSATQTLHCAQTVCVIDDVTISVLGKSNVGDISFGQSCSSCGTGAGCTCNISDISITSVESTLGNINLAQQCGNNNVNCFKRDASGVPQKVDCSELGGTGNSTSASTKGTALRNILIIIGIIVAVIVIIIIIALVLRRNRNEPTMLRNPDPYLAPPPNYYYSGTNRGPAGFSGSDTYLANAPLI